MMAHRAGSAAAGDASPRLSVVGDFRGAEDESPGGLLCAVPSPCHGLCLRPPRQVAVGLRGWKAHRSQMLGMVQPVPDSWREHGIRNVTRVAARCQLGQCRPSAPALDHVAGNGY